MKGTFGMVKWSDLLLEMTAETAGRQLEGKLFACVCLCGYVLFEAVCGIWKCDRKGIDFSNNFVLKKRQQVMFSQKHFALKSVKY